MIQARHLASVRQALSVLGLVSVSVVATLAVQHVIARAAIAQPAQAQEVRSERFVLVARDGTELARLDPGGDGNGRLQLRDSGGTLRVVLAGQGSFIALDPDGSTVRFRSGYVDYVDASGRAPINGIWLDPDAAISVVPPGSIQR